MTWLIIVLILNTGVSATQIPVSSMEQCKIMAEQMYAQKPWWYPANGMQTYCINDKDKIERVNGVPYTIA